MNCCERIDDFLDGELSPLEQAEFLECCRTCETCHTTASEWESIAWQLKSGWNQIDPPAHSEQAEQNNKVSVAEVTRPHRQPRRRWLAMSVIAASLGCLALTLAVYRPSGLRDRRVGDSPNAGTSAAQTNESSPSQSDSVVAPPLRTPARATVRTSEDFIVVSQVSDEDLTWVEVIPTFRPSADAETEEQKEAL